MFLLTYFRLGFTCCLTNFTCETEYLTNIFGIGEHHRKDYAASALAVLLVAAASQAKNIEDVMRAIELLGKEEAPIVCVEIDGWEANGESN